MKYLLDTCAISEPLKAKPNEKFMRWLKQQEEDSLYLSVLTVGELHKGIYKLKNDNRRKQILSRWINDDLIHRFDRRILLIDQDIVKVCGKILGESERTGRKIPVVDGLIAATALVHDLIVVTRNSKDLDKTSVPVENPWIIPSH